MSLPFLDLGEELQNDDPRTQGDGKLFGVDDSTSPAITLPSALPFGNVTMTTAYVRLKSIIIIYLVIIYINSHRFPAMGL